MRKERLKMCFSIHHQLSTEKVIKWQIPFTPRKSHFLTHKSEWEGLGRSLDGENASCLIVFKQSCFQVCGEEDTLSQTQSVCVKCQLRGGGWNPLSPCEAPAEQPEDAAALSHFTVCSRNCRSI